MGSNIGGMDIPCKEPCEEPCGEPCGETPEETPDRLLWNIEEPREETPDLLLCNGDIFALDEKECIKYLSTHQNKVLPFYEWLVKRDTPMFLSGPRANRGWWGFITVEYYWDGNKIARKDIYQPYFLAVIRESDKLSLPIFTQGSKETRKYIGKIIVEYVAALICTGTPLLGYYEITDDWWPYICMRIVGKDQIVFYLTPLLHALLDVRTELGHTLLYKAACHMHMYEDSERYGMAHLVKVLVACGHKVSLLNHRGDSVLHGIAWGDSKDWKTKCSLIDWFLRIDPNLRYCRNDRGESFIDILERKHPETKGRYTLSE